MSSPIDNETFVLTLTSAERAQVIVALQNDIKGYRQTIRKLQLWPAYDAEEGRKDLEFNEMCIAELDAIIDRLV